MSSPVRWRWRRTTAADSLLAVVLVTVAVVEALANPGAPHPWARVGLAALAVATVAARRTHPTMAACVLAACVTIQSLVAESPDEVAVLVAYMVVSYSVAAHALQREALLGGVVLALSVSVAIASDPSDSLSNVLPSLLLFAVLPFGLGMAMRRRKQRIETLTLQTYALALDADEAVDAERRRIARELHDVVSHAVTLIAVQAEAGRSVIDRDPDAARRSLEAIGQVSREALEELSRLLAVLHDQTPDAKPGLAGLSSLAEGARAAGLTVLVRDEGQTGPLEPAADRCAYRVVQEGLTNALRHTSSARVEVVVDREPAFVRITVTSHGRRHTSAYGGTGRGLVGLHERVLALGGHFEAGPVGEDGFRLRAEVPVAIGVLP